MADTKISALTELTSGNVAAGDELPIVDVSDTAMAASGTTKFVKHGSLFVPARFAAFNNAAPADGDVWYGSTQKALAAQLDGLTQRLAGCLFTGTAAVTVSNTSVETTLLGAGVGTLTLPAGFWVVGKTLRIRAHGVFSSLAASPGQSLLRAYLGATAVFDTGNFSLMSSAAGFYWGVELHLTCLSAGVSGTVAASGARKISQSTSGQQNFHANTLANPIAVDTTAPAAIDLRWKFGTADPGNSTTLYPTTIEVLN